MSTLYVFKMEAKEDLEELIQITFKEVKMGDRGKPKLFTKIKRRYCRYQLEYKRNYGHFYEHYKKE